MAAYYFLRDSLSCDHRKIVVIYCSWYTCRGSLRTLGEVLHQLDMVVVIQLENYCAVLVSTCLTDWKCKGGAKV